MIRVRSLLVVVFSLLVLHGSAFAQAPALSIVNTGPEGPLASLAQANEIRIVFSEPMVTLGRIPSPVTAPFVRITPGHRRRASAGRAPTILIFTPDPQRPLPYATTYEVTIDATATAVSGRRLARPTTFRFTTPTVQLLQTNW